MNGEKMQLSNRDVLLAVKGLLQIGNTQIEGRTSYWLARNFKNLAAIEKKVMERRNDIIKRLGTLDEKKGQYAIPETIGEGENEKRNPAEEQADKEYNAILDEAVEVEIMKVKVDGFGKVGMNALAAIGFMLDEPGVVVKVK
jgi:neutral trehalase